jgi:hypothetical protein
MINNFTLYTTVPISHEQYKSFLTELGARTLSKPGKAPYDARLTRDETRHLRLCLLEGESLQFSFLELAPNLEEVTRMLDASPVAAIKLDLSDEGASLNLLADAVHILAKHFKCVIEDETGELRFPDEVEALAYAEYDGYHWDKNHKRVAKDE